MRRHRAYILAPILIVLLTGAATLHHFSSTESPKADALLDLPAQRPTVIAPAPAARGSVGSSDQEAPLLRRRLAHLSVLHMSVRQTIRARSTKETIDEYLNERRAIIGLGRGIVPELISILGDDSDPGVRIMALQILGAVGGPEALEALVRIHCDLASDTGFRLAAVHAIANLKDADPVPALTEILRAGPGASEAAEALGRRRARRALPDLIDMLADESDVSRSCHAATALGRIGGAVAGDALEASASRADDPLIRRAARQALISLKESP